MQLRGRQKGPVGLDTPLSLNSSTGNQRYRRFCFAAVVLTHLRTTLPWWDLWTLYQKSTQQQKLLAR